MSLLVALNPVLLGIVLLIISRPRPVQKLLAFWLGALTVNLPLFLAPLALLNLTPGFASFAQAFAAPATATATGGSAIRPTPLVIGAIFLLVAAAMTVRLWMRRRSESQEAVASGRRLGGRHRAQRGRTGVPTTGGATSTLVLESSGPRDESGPLGRVKGMASRVGSEVRRLYGRLLSTWENGSVRVTFVFGMLYLPSVTLVLLVDTTIVTSGAGIGEQVFAAAAFVVGFLAVLEITWLSYVVAPGKTAAVLRPLHDWAQTYSRQILIAFFTLIAIWQLSRGFSIG
ncbi:MAG: GAP family protein [Mycobacterium sp.]